MRPQEPLREINIQDHKDKGIFDIEQKINELGGYASTFISHPGAITPQPYEEKAEAKAKENGGFKECYRLQDRELYIELNISQLPLPSTGIIFIQSFSPGRDMKFLVNIMTMAFDRLN